MDLRPGNYIHPPAAAGDASSRYLRVVSVDLMTRTVAAKADFSNEPETFNAGEISGCALEALMDYIGGLSFDGHSLLIGGAGAVSVIAAGGAPIELPHIRYVHQFQNLFRSLTGQELPVNLGRQS